MKLQGLAVACCILGGVSASVPRRCLNEVCAVVILVIVFLQRHFDAVLGSCSGGVVLVVFPMVFVVVVPRWPGGGVCASGVVVFWCSW